MLLAQLFSSKKYAAELINRILYQTFNSLKPYFVQLFDIDVFNKLFSNTIVVLSLLWLEKHKFMDFVSTPAYYIQVKRGGLFLDFLTHFPCSCKDHQSR